MSAVVIDGNSQELRTLQDRLAQAQPKYAKQLNSSYLRVAYVVLGGTRKAITIAKATRFENARAGVDYVVYVSDTRFLGLSDSVQAFLLFSTLYRTFDMDGTLLPVNQTNLELAKLFGVDPILYPNPELLEAMPNLLETPLGEAA